VPLHIVITSKHREIFQIFSQLLFCIFSLDSFFLFLTFHFSKVSAFDWINVHNWTAREEISATPQSKDERRRWFPAFDLSAGGFKFSPALRFFIDRKFPRRNTSRAARKMSFLTFPSSSSNWASRKYFLDLTRDCEDTESIFFFGDHTKENRVSWHTRKIALQHTRSGEQLKLETELAHRQDVLESLEMRRQRISFFSRLSSTLHVRKVENLFLIIHRLIPHDKAGFKTH
jgi:hypothetical protein